MVPLVPGGCRGSVDIGGGCYSPDGPRAMNFTLLCFDSGAVNQQYWGQPYSQDSGPRAELSKIQTIRSLNADRWVQTCVHIEISFVAPFLPLPWLCPRMRSAQGYGSWWLQVGFHRVHLKLRQSSAAAAYASPGPSSAEQAGSRVSSVASPTQCCPTGLQTAGWSTCTGRAMRSGSRSGHANSADADRREETCLSGTCALSCRRHRGSRSVKEVLSQISSRPNIACGVGSWWRALSRSWYTSSDWRTPLVGSAG